jgi:hypothetical protein
MSRVNKRGQQLFGMSFGWIFAIILIVIFILVAVYAINFFMDFGQCSRIGNGMENLQQEIDLAYQSSSTSREIDVDLPGVDKLCFANLSKSSTGSLQIYEEIDDYAFPGVNAFLYPAEDSCNMPYKSLKHVDLEKTILNSNPACFDVVDGKATIRLEKGVYDKAVSIK